MKNLYPFSHPIVLFVFAFVLSCAPNSLEEPDGTGGDDTGGEDSTPIGEQAILDLEIPEGFTFKTSNEVTISIFDAAPDAFYTVYAYNDAVFNEQEVDVTNEDGETEAQLFFETDELNQVLFKGRPVGGMLENTVVMPSYYRKIYLRRSEQGVFTTQIMNIQSGAVSYTHSDNSGKSRLAQVAAYRASSKQIDVDLLYCVNGSGQLFTVDPLNGDLVEKADMPQGSWTAAIDHTNLYLYSIGKNRNYPLMRYDIINDSWTTIGNVGMGGPRLDYNENDGLLYFSRQDKLYTIDPSNATVLSNWTIANLNNKNGGDLAFAPDGTIFLSSFGGLYRLDEVESGYWAVRISADNLPFNPTSMTFDSNDELWLASNGGSSDLIIMDTQTGGWEYIYGPNSTTNVDLGRTVNDLTTYTVTEEVEDPDTDGDGITDSNDQYPNEADKAFEIYTPSRYGWGTVAFEDLWPFLGDYDFNDTAINYRFVAIQNAQNEVVELEINFEVTSDGAGLTNGFGIEFESIAPSQVESVTGTVLTEGYINVAANGVEEGQSRAVVILFDNNETMLNITSKAVVRFTTPLTTAQLGIAPFNAFLIVNRDRGREIHLPNRLRTSLGVNDPNVDGVNRDPDGNYATDARLPWAINIVHDFKVPKERVPVNQAYNFFNQWATSGGTVYDDWYKDNTGYRNVNNIKNQ